MLLNLEDAAKLIVSYLGTLWLGYDWWLFFALLLLPDLSMIGYVVNARLGALTYNIGHHQGVAILAFIAGYILGPGWLMLAGLVLFGHSAMDRIFGYGLKYADDFKHTHLGYIGKQS